MKRSSKTNHATGGSGDGLQCIPEAKWQYLRDCEDRDLFILELRDELIKRVLNECYDLYFERQCVKFTVHCAHQAWKQLFRWAFFKRDPGDEYYFGNPSWSPDKPIPPSTVDTWAAQATPIIPKPQKMTRSTSIHVTDMEDPCADYPKDNVFGEPDPVADDYYQEAETMNVILQPDSSPRLRVVTTTSTGDSNEEELPSPVTKHHTSRAHSTTDFANRYSIFTRLKTMRQESLPTAALPAGYPLVMTKSLEPQFRLSEECVTTPYKIPPEKFPDLRTAATYVVMSEVFRPDPKMLELLKKMEAMKP